MKTIEEFYNDEIKKFKEQVSDMIFKAYNESGVIEPVLFALIIKDGVTTLGILGGLEQLFVGNEELKEKAAEVIKKFNKEFKPIAIAFASEAYVLTAPVNKTVIDEDGVYLDDSFRPSVNPDSKECVVINFETAKEQGIMYWEIIKIGDLKDLSLIQDLKLEPKTESEALGILSNLLEENYSEVTELAKKANINFNTN